MKLFLSSLAAILLALTLGVFAAGNAGPPKPNFLILHTDDQRPDTLGCYNPDTPIKTPHIDSLATTGMRNRRPE